MKRTELKTSVAFLLVIALFVAIIELQTIGLFAFVTSAGISAVIVHAAIDCHWSKD